MSERANACFDELMRVRRALIRAYLVHVAWFLVMCALVGWRWSQKGLQASVLLTLITVPPVLYYTVRVHSLCRTIDPHARTVGWLPVLVTTFILSPFESGLVLPLKNLLACNKLLRKMRAPSTEAGADDAGAPPDAQMAGRNPGPAASQPGPCRM